MPTAHMVQPVHHLIVGVATMGSEVTKLALPYSLTLPMQQSPSY